MSTITSPSPPCENDRRTLYEDAAYEACIQDPAASGPCMQCRLDELKVELERTQGTGADIGVHE